VSTVYRVMMLAVIAAAVAGGIALGMWMHTVLST
jgi:hypothetical protein